MSKIPSEAEVLEYFNSLSNWGRWGDEDQKGTLNFLTSDITKNAITLVRSGETVSCARPLVFEPTVDATGPAVHYMVESGEGWASGDKVTSRVTQAATDYIGMVFHGYTVTHVDSLAHFFWEGQMYNGQPAHLVSTNLGATAESIEIAGEGIVSKGVLVDVPRLRGAEWLERGEGVMPDDILAAEEKYGFKIEEGDVLLIRTGQLHRREVEGPVDFRSVGSTACHAACLPLFHDRKISMLGTDTGNDVMPAPYPNVIQPIHQVGIVAMGLWILDNANLEDLSDTCHKLGRFEFLINIAPLKLTNTTGSPVNPIAIF